MDGEKLQEDVRWRVEEDPLDRIDHVSNCQRLKAS
jgi:hypothetical protein